MTVATEPADIKIGFLDPLEIEYMDGRNWRITREFVYRTAVLLEGSKGLVNPVVRIPAGFVTDFASIPQLFWNILPPTGPYGKAAVVHDALYRTVPGLATRSQADRVLLEAMKQLGTPAWERWTIYAAVRVGGACAYKGGL